MACAIEIPRCEGGSWPGVEPTHLSLLSFLGGNAAFVTQNAAPVTGGVCVYVCEDGVQ